MKESHTFQLQMAKYLAADNDPQKEMTQSQTENGVSLTDCTSVCIFGHFAVKVDHNFGTSSTIFGE